MRSPTPTETIAARRSNASAASPAVSQIAGKTDTPKLQVRLLQKLLNDDIASRLRGNQIQAKHFREEISKLLARYEADQLSSAEIVDALVAVAKKLRAARKRNEQLGLSEERLPSTTRSPAAPMT